MAARIGLLDIETAPNLGYTWGRYDQNVIAFKEQSYFLCYGWKWLGTDEVETRSLVDYKGYQPGAPDDRALVLDLWELFDRADVIVAHNGDAFDVKKSNARFVLHDLPPPSPYKTVDTLKLARKHFKFESNKLTDLGAHLGLGEKLSTGGFKLWLQVMAGDAEAWKQMVAYNVQDVLLLEKVYEKFKPWAVTHPNLNLYEQFPQEENCPKCGSNHTQRRGYSYAKVQVRQRFQCQACLSWFSGKLVKKDKPSG